ncbi:MAG: HPr family phosphocarrier protein [Actinomycetaceae bacterium]|nr:HPr family phosphocarrier protein [Actinomycetaceae bacterium]MDY6083569.1 HPr family phosphocarrier protein [Actinomycetaceae bacterium]
MISRTATIAATVGLHARPASIFVNAVDESGTDVTITLDGESADASSILEVMSLGAAHGDTVTISTDDDAAGDVLDNLVTVLQTDWDAE